MPEIITIKLAYSRAYLIKENGKNLIVDTGLRGNSGLFGKRLKENGVDPSDISLIVITHVHYDHVGNLAWLKEQSKAPVLVSSIESGMLEEGKSVTPSGTIFLSRIISAIGQFYNPFAAYEPVKPDLIFTDFVSLNNYGFSAVIIPTPGHTAGSISVIFGSGETIVGDTCFRFYNGKSVFPVFANDVQTLLKSWQTLLDSEALVFYPGHGRPFTRDALLVSYREIQHKYSLKSG